MEPLPTTGVCSRCGKMNKVVSLRDLDLPIYICIDRNACTESLSEFVRKYPERNLIYADGVNLRVALFYRWLYNKNRNSEVEEGEGFVVPKTMPTL